MIYEHTFVYTPGVVGYRFKLIGDVLNNTVLFLFTPRFLGVS
jgi:hypothetical protein